MIEFRLFRFSRRAVKKAHSLRSSQIFYPPYPFPRPSRRLRRRSHALCFQKAYVNFLGRQA